MEVDWEQSVFSLKIHEEECKKSKYAMVSMICVRVAMVWVASTAGVRRWGKKETAMVSCNILDAQNYGDRVILLVSVQIKGMTHIYK